MQKKNMPNVDENTLIYAVLHGKDTAARCAALKKIENVETIADDLLQDEDPNIRFAILEKIGPGEKNTLTRIALYDEDKHVRCAALMKIKDIEILIRIALHDKDEDVRNIAAERYEHSERYDRSKAVERICNVKALIYIVMCDKDALIRQEAVKKIDDAEALMEVALHDKDKNVRCDAVRRINEVHGTEVMVKVMKQADDKYIRKYVRRLAAEKQFSMMDKRK